MITKIIVGVVALGVLVTGMIYFSRPAVAPTNGESVTDMGSVSASMPVPGNADVEEHIVQVQEDIKETVVEMTSAGFSPSAVTVKKGTIVTFINKDSRLRWPASATHPQHTCYPGFDSRPGVEPGQSFTFTANEAKTCGFHDHLNIGLRGTLTVTE
ncbi:MAG TPA: hypothetical protein VJC20_01090 [Candidatus Paceibacterota bacterium]|uniref:EfeO-type cupredoxin-like domain-containing protein n=1 Tax=Candidatus Buchananbacteria bacterium RIFCSPLOWO2_01_FULL_46_12 TaxID=1797546 RepID=A0A1G1YTF4_9BACT|nr:MAG: hypothetical protein A3A24_03645 [Candidatus Buchananbacteria bacterium RIFCSPLOWO2_01_FULL_46_12]